MGRANAGPLLAGALLAAGMLLHAAGQEAGQNSGRRRLDVPGAAPRDNAPGSSPENAPDSPPARHGPGVKGLTEPDEPEHPEPAATDFRDAKYGLSFHIPAGWNFERQDGVLSNFGVDVRSTRRRLDVRGVAAINYNPYPVSTFAGAMFYYSVLPQADAAGCAAQASSLPVKAAGDVRIGGVLFHHGHDQHGSVCTEARNEVFTAMRGRTCLRFDLVVNTFCSETSGAMTLSKEQLGDVDTRLGNILRSVQIDGR